MQYVINDNGSSFDMSSLKEIATFCSELYDRTPSLVRGAIKPILELVIQWKVQQICEPVPVFPDTCEYVAVGTNLGNGLAAIMGNKKGQPHIPVVKRRDINLDDVSMRTVENFWGKTDWGKYTTIVCLAKEMCSRIPANSEVVILSQDCVAEQEVKWLNGIHDSDPNAVEFGSSGIKSLPKGKRVRMVDYKTAAQVFQDMESVVTATVSA